MTLKEILEQLNFEEIEKSREAQYGDFNETIIELTELWGSLLQYRLKPHQAALMMSVLKINRVFRGNFVADNYVDAIAYIARAYELQEKENAS